MFANIGAESSKLATFRWMAGWDREGFRYNFPVQLWIYWATNHFFWLGFSRYDFRRRTRKSNEFWCLTLECESSWDDGYRMIWVKPIEENESSKQICFWKSSELMKGMSSRTQWLVTRAGSVLITNRIPCLQCLHSIFDQVTFEDLQLVLLNWMERLSLIVEHDGAYFQE
jgi:hypothetical protein